MDIPKPTHDTMVLHINELPIPVIIDDNPSNRVRYDNFTNTPTHYSLDVKQFFVENDRGIVKPGEIIITLKLKTKDDLMEFVISPDNNFIIELIISKKLHFGNSHMSYFQFPISTKEIENVWESS